MFSGPNPTEVTTLLEIGSERLPLRYFLAKAVTPQRRIVVRPLSKDIASVSVLLNGATQVLLPTALRMVDLRRGPPEILLRLLRGTQPGRLLALHSAENEHLALALMSTLEPELLAWPSERPAPLRDLAAAPDLVDMEILGLGSHSLLATAGATRMRDKLLISADGIRREAAGRNSTLYRVEEVEFVEGSWGIETHEGASWVWTGPQRATTMLVQPPPSSPWRLTIFFYAATVPISAEALGLQIGGRLVKPRYYPDEMKIECDIDDDYSHAPCLVVRLLHSRLTTTEDGSRIIGYAVHKIKCETLT